MQATAKHENRNSSKIIVMPNLYNETMNILLDARHYFSHYAHQDQTQLNLMDRLVYSSEMSRITLRLSTIMSWLLARRALNVGQLTMDEVRQQYALQFREVCMVDGKFFSDVLPAYVLELHAESLKLYRRVLALDHAELQAHSA